MKYLILALTILTLVNCTPEKIQQIQDNLITQIVTNGQWKVTTYTKGASDESAAFAGYKFQFKNNSSVDALLTSNNNVSATGTWSADANARTITSAFPASSNATLQLLNGTWSITKNSTTYVEAEQTVNGERRFLRLDKLP